MRPFAAAAAGVILAALGLAGTAETLERLPTDRLLTPLYQARVESDSIAFIGPKATTPAFWIAPFDDSLYASNGSTPLTAHDAFTVQNSALGELLLDFEAVRGRNLLVWHVSGRPTSAAGDIIYVVDARTANEVEIARTLDNVRPAATAIGQTIRYCDECRLEIPGQAGAATIVDTAGDRIKLAVPAGAELKVVPADHTVEMKTPVGAGQPAAVSQQASFGPA